MPDPYKIFPHTADVGLKISGKSRNEIFENAALGLTYLLTDPKKLHATKTISFSLQAGSWEELLVSWLNEILFFFTVKKISFLSFRVRSAEPFSLNASARGEKLTKKHPVFKEIKAVTYHNLKITRRNKIYSARLILDI